MANFNGNFYDDDFDDGHEDDDELFDCAMGPDGQCDKAGSEECDWECPVMQDIYAAEARKRKARAPEAQFADKAGGV